MILLILLTAAFAATSLKTIFSYVTSEMFHQPFQEPYLLAAVISHFNVLDTKTNRRIGLGVQYAMGFLFVIVFQALLANGWMTLSYENILLYGSLIGIFSILFWAFLFVKSQSRPQMNAAGYYSLLFAGHIVFAFAMAGCYIII
ncbi:hypothetical protein [Flavobacterium wongokense]|uniref:hypothetical protein n=1 Tax=Flavobacterium wongokense TaxID=2910674 RepID=UPI001F20BB6A|nr:hypothetical protein [Flavobacterium sp. WG47]MCF6132499.1 hypothetical protein [Flavobacterium sp. WG47]